MVWWVNFLYKSKANHPISWWHTVHFCLQVLCKDLHFTTLLLVKTCRFYLQLYFVQKRFTLLWAAIVLAVTFFVTVHLQMNRAVSKVNKKYISYLTRAKRTPSAAATLQVSHALPAVRFSCLLRGRGVRFQDGAAAGKGFLCLGWIWLPCGCVSCDPGCTHWRIVINT